MSQSRRRTGDAIDGTDLVLPLSGHDLGVGARDVDLGVHAGAVVSLDDVTAVNLAGSDTAVVWALRSGETVLGPSVWPAGVVEKGVLLLKTEPDVVVLVLVQDDGGIVAVVVLVWLSVGAVRLAHDQDVVAQSEGVRVEGHGPEVDIRVVAGGLAGRRAVEIPFRQLGDVLDLLVQSLEYESATRTTATSVRVGGSIAMTKEDEMQGCGTPLHSFVRGADGDKAPLFA